MTQPVFAKTGCVHSFCPDTPFRRAVKRHAFFTHKNNKQEAAPAIENNAFLVSDKNFNIILFDVKIRHNKIISESGVYSGAGFSGRKPFRRIVSFGRKTLNTGSEQYRINPDFMIDYTTWRVIGQGTERTCYQNPTDRTRCVKIIRKARFKQTLREISYFSYLKRKGVPFDHLPRFYRKIEGEGFIGIEQELIQDFDQSIGRKTETENANRSVSSPTIHQYLSIPRSPGQIREFLEALDELKSYLLRYNILALGIDHNNIVVQNTGNGIRMVLIDGVYDTEWIPISKYLRFFGSRKILRRWNRFISNLHDRYPQLGNNPK